MQEVFKKVFLPRFSFALRSLSLPRSEVDKLRPDTIFCAAHESLKKITLLSLRFQL